MEESNTRSNIHPGMIPQEGKCINTYDIMYDRRSLVTSVLAIRRLLTYLPGYCKELCRTSLRV